MEKYKVGTSSSNMGVPPLGILYMSLKIAVADPGIFEVGVPTLGGGEGGQHTILPIFFQQLDEIERIWVPGGRPLRPPYIGHWIGDSS